MRFGEDGRPPLFCNEPPKLVDPAHGLVITNEVGREVGLSNGHAAARKQQRLRLSGCGEP